MRIRRLLPFAAVVALLSPALIAGSMEKYKNWPSSPQGYFMTKAERAAWTANVKTDAEAEAFINKFVESRGGVAFTQDVAKRGEMADKHLTVSRRAGSLSMRGKIVIVLGPPSSFAVSTHEIKGNASAASDSYLNINPTAGPSVGDMSMAASRRGMGGDVLKDYTFTYAADRLPVKQSKDFTVVVEVRAGDGSDRVVDRKAAEQLEAMFEAAAEARLAAAKP